MAGLAMGLGAWGLAPPPASAGVVDDLFEQVGVLDSLSYRFVSSYDAGGGKLIERSHDAIANVPGLLDVDDKLGPDVTATLSSIDGKNATLTITTIGGKKLPLAMQTPLPDPGVRSMYFGYDARAGAAPSTFTAKLSLLSEEHVRIDATTAGAQPGVFAVNGGTFRPVGKKRVDPVIVSATFDKTPAKAKIDAELGAKKRFTLTSGGGTAALVRAELATGEALDRIEALVPVLPTWVQVQYDADEPAGSRHVVYDASSKTADVAFAYSQFLAGIERQRMDIRFADVPQKADVVQDQTHVRLFTSTPLARVDVALRQAAGLMQIGGKTVRSLTARADELPTDLTVDYQGGTKGYRVKPKTGRLDLVELRLSSLLDPQPVPAGLGARAWGDGRHLPGPGDIASRRHRARRPRARG